MLQDQTLAVVQEIFQAIFMQDNPYTLSELRTKFASSLQLPELVTDSTTGEPTYSILPGAAQYITCANSEKRSDTNGWILTDKSPTSDIDQLEKIWHDINSITTERVFNSENVHASDPIYNCTNIYSSTNCGDSHYLIYCSGTFRSRYALASKRSDTLNYCINVDDSNSCTNSYQVTHFLSKIVAIYMNVFGAAISRIRNTALQTSNLASQNITSSSPKSSIASCVIYNI